MGLSLSVNILFSRFYLFIKKKSHHCEVCLLSERIWRNTRQGRNMRCVKTISPVRRAAWRINGQRCTRHFDPSQLLALLFFNNPTSFVLYNCDKKYFKKENNSVVFTLSKFINWAAKTFLSCSDFFFLK